MPQVVFGRAVLYLYIPHLVLIAGVASTQVPDLALLNLMRFPGPTAQPVSVPLDGILSLGCVDSTLQLGVISNLAEDAVYPAVSVSEDIKEY